MDPAEDELVALVVGPDPLAPSVLAVVGSARIVPEGAWSGSTQVGMPLLADLERRHHPRWVVWSAAAALRPLVMAREGPSRCWDLAECHRLLEGGWRADPGVVWALATGLDPRQAPRPSLLGPGGPDLFSVTDEGSADPLDAAGFLRSEALDPAWVSTPERALILAKLARRAADGQHRLLPRLGVRGRYTVAAESAAAVLCLELERDGLPVDRAELERLIATAAGPRPTDADDERRLKAARDAVVLAAAPPRAAPTDLRNPAQVKALLGAAGVTVETTRKWELEPYRASHPLVAALLRWRADERIATTFGYRWVDEHVGPDDRLRGTWSACDGAAGRMTAQNGLHSLPALLRPGVAAHDGHVLVRADLGQIEPRVLAVVSGDRALAAATAADDLYQPVAQRLGVERAVAKVAMLAAMYGQRSGAAGEALAGMERAFPVATTFLDRAYATGVGRGVLRTYGGRLIRLDDPEAGAPGAAAEQTEPGPGSSALSAAARRGRDAARGRYARNAVVQGSAAELFKAWAATVRHAVAPSEAQVVLCLHDELLIHAPEPRAEEVAAAVVSSLDSSARRWAGTDAVRFVAEIAIVHRWSEAK